MRIDQVLADALRVASFRCAGVRVGARDEGTTAALHREAGRLRAAFGDLAIGSVPGVRAARDLYRALGIDPTRTRPSSEALLRRALRRKPMPQVNAAVDVANLVSLRTLLPVGLYDVDRVEGPIEIRLGRAGEEYPGIGKDVVHLEGRIAVCDASGPFGNPTSDSARTRVTESTEALLFVLFAPAGRSEDELRVGLRAAEEEFRRAIGGTVEDVAFAP